MKSLKKHCCNVKIWALLLLLFLLAGCAPQPAPAPGLPVDALGNPVVLTPKSRVVSCYASFTECWMLAGGTLAGVTRDAIEERNLALNDIPIVGTVKEINLEQVAALNPDLVILSADLAAHLSLKESLTQMGIPTAYFRVDTFEDYSRLMELFCNATQNPAAFDTYVTQVQQRIDAILAKIPPKTEQTALLMRAYSTGIKAKGEDHLAGQILKEFDILNIADLHPSLLEELSPEEIIRQDPDLIFISTMGNEESAKAYLADNLEKNPAWQGLKAVQSGRYTLLPQELFHYKPNHRWDESYEYLAKIIFPEIFVS